MDKTIHFIFSGSTIHLNDKAERAQELLEIKLNYSKKFSLHFVVYSQIGKLEAIRRRISEKKTSLIIFFTAIAQGRIAPIQLILN